MVRGVFIQRSGAERMTVADALKRYLDEVPKKPSTAAADARRAKSLIASLGQVFDGRADA